MSAIHSQIYHRPTGFPEGFGDFSTTLPYPTANLSSNAEVHQEDIEQIQRVLYDRLRKKLTQKGKGKKDSS